MLEVIPGAKIVGKSGNKLLVDRIEGDNVWVGDRKIHRSAIVRVIPPTPVFKVGDLVRFKGSYQEWGIEFGEILTVVEDCEEWVRTRTTGRKPISVLRSDLEVMS